MGRYDAVVCGAEGATYVAQYFGDDKKGEACGDAITGVVHGGLPWALFSGTSSYSSMSHDFDSKGRDKLRLQVC